MDVCKTQMKSLYQFPPEILTIMMLGGVFKRALESSFLSSKPDKSKVLDFIYEDILANENCICK